MKKTSRSVCPLVNRLSTYPLWRHSGTLAHAAASARVVNLCEPLFRPRRQILKVRRYAVDLRECWVASSNPTARPLHVSQRRIPRPRNARGGGDGSRDAPDGGDVHEDRKSTRLNSSH